MVQWCSVQVKTGLCMTTANGHRCIDTDIDTGEQVQELCHLRLQRYRIRKKKADKVEVP